MAKKLAPGDAKKLGGVSAVDLKRVVNEINKHGKNASENSGLKGQAVKQAVELYNVDRKALMSICSMAKQEPSQAQGTIRSLMKYAHLYGLFDQVDAFDDLIPTLKGIIADVEGRAEKTPKRDAAMGSLLGSSVN